MSKELEALEKIGNILATGGAVINQTTNFEILKQALIELETLRAKEVPMKVIITPYKKNIVDSQVEFYIGYQYSCDKCKTVLFRDRWAKTSNELHLFYDLSKYCSSCGQRLDWSDENE